MIAGDRGVSQKSTKRGIQGANSGKVPASMISMDATLAKISSELDEIN